MPNSITIVRVYPDTPQGVFLQWKFVPNPGEAGPFNFLVERSGSPDGPWATIDLVINGLNSYDTIAGNEDDGPNLLSVHRSIWYRVSVGNCFAEPVNLDGQRANDWKQQYQVDGSPAIRKRKILLRRKIIRDEDLTFRVLNGVKIGVFKRRHFGTRCTICYDPVTKMTTKTKCVTCFSTSWVGGYYPPIMTLGRVAPTPTQVTLTNEGKSEFNATTVTLLNYPLVEEGDFLVELDSNTRWLIKQISPTELRRLTVHQTVQVMELPKGAPEYNLDIPSAVIHNDKPVTVATTTTTVSERAAVQNEKQITAVATASTIKELV